MGVGGVGGEGGRVEVEEKMKGWRWRGRKDSCVYVCYAVHHCPTPCREAGSDLLKWVGTNGPNEHVARAGFKGVKCALRRLAN